MRKLYRAEESKKVAGVCAGLAKYADIDVSLLRIITLILIVLSGIVPGIMLYFLIALILPLEGHDHA